jgi:hypothetical protein
MRRSSISKQGMTTRNIASHIILLTLALFGIAMLIAQAAD